MVSWTIPRNLQRGKILELINEYIKVTGYKINIQKSIAFLNSSSQQSESEIKKITPFKTALK